MSDRLLIFFFQTLAIIQRFLLRNKILVSRLLRIASVMKMAGSTLWPVVVYLPTNFWHLTICKLVNFYWSLSCSFTYVTLYILFWLFFCSLLCVSVFHVWSLSLDYIFLISARILVPMITIVKCQFHTKSLWYLCQKCTTEWQTKTCYVVCNWDIKLNLVGCWYAWITSSDFYEDCYLRLLYKVFLYMSYSEHLIKKCSSSSIAEVLVTSLFIYCFLWCLCCGVTLAPFYFKCSSTYSKTC